MRRWKLQHPQPLVPCTRPTPTIPSLSLVVNSVRPSSCGINDHQGIVTHHRYLQKPFQSRLKSQNSPLWNSRPGIEYVTTHFAPPKKSVVPPRFRLPQFFLVRLHTSAPGNLRTSSGLPPWISLPFPGSPPSGHGSPPPAPTGSTKLYRQTRLSLAHTAAHPRCVPMTRPAPPLPPSNKRHTTVQHRLAPRSSNQRSSEDIRPFFQPSLDARIPLDPFSPPPLSTDSYSVQNFR